MTGQERVTLISEKLNEQMERKGLSIKDVADKAGSTYEHVRNIVRGNVVPSKYMLRTLSDILGLNQKELEKIAVADRIRIKYGSIPLELSGKNPEIEPIERDWGKLTDAHKKDIITMVQAYAARDVQSKAS